MAAKLTLLAPPPFPTALLKYWKFEAMTDSARKAKAESSSDDADPVGGRPTPNPHDLTEATMREGWGSPSIDLRTARTVEGIGGGKEEDGAAGKEGEEDEPVPPRKKYTAPYFGLPP